MIRGRVIPVPSKEELDIISRIIPKTPDGKVIIMDDQEEPLSPIERLQILALNKIFNVERESVKNEIL